MFVFYCLNFGWNLFYIVNIMCLDKLMIRGCNNFWGIRLYKCDIKSLIVCYYIFFFFYDVCVYCIICWLV